MAKVSKPLSKLSLRFQRADRQKGDRQKTGHQKIENAMNGRFATGKVQLRTEITS
jgi:hypothetical protein